MEAGRLVNQVPFVRRVAKEEEEAREKRRGTTASLTAGSIAAKESEGGRGMKRPGSRDRKSEMK